jgi:hypothetical protein
VILLRCMSPVLSVAFNPSRQCLLIGVKRTAMLGAVMRAFDPSATLAVHRGNGFDAGLSPIEVLV